MNQENDQYVEVISGLFPGDEAVTQGSYALSFSGSGSGMSLKEALDAAHGHEHNEDGTPVTEEQKAAKEESHDDHAHEGDAEGSGNAAMNQALMLYAAVTTLLFLIAAQMLWK